MHPLTVFTFALCSGSLSSAFSFSHLVPDVVRRSLSSTPSLEKRAPSIAQLSFCRDFGGPDAPGNVCVPLGVSDDHFRGAFEVDKAALNQLIGAPPSGAKVNTPGTICGLGTKIEFEGQGFLGLNRVPRCRGARILVLDSEFRDLVGELNDNVACIACFQSPSP